MDILMGILGMSVSLAILLGTGAGITWWATQRFEERIRREVRRMDRLQSIERNVLNIENRVSNIEEKMTSMATKEDLTSMATKEDLTSMATKEDLTNMVTKEDLTNMVAGMATKEDLSKMVTKEDMVELLDAINDRNGRDRQG